MATVQVVLCTIRGRSDPNHQVPVAPSAVDGSDTVTSSGSSALSTLSGALGQVWSITPLGPVWVNFGTGTPVAGAEAGWLIPTGIPREFAVSADGEKVAIKDAS